MNGLLNSRLVHATRFGHNIANIPLRRPQTSTPIQAKLTIGEPGDKYEQEADETARQVVQRIHQSQGEKVQRESLPEEEEELQMKLEGSIQRESLPLSEDELQMKPMLQRVADEGMATSPDLETSIQQSRGSGQPLADSIKSPMEQAFGADFSGVKVHTDTRADQLNQSIQAKAFTTGQDVFFRQGVYQPGSRDGQELLAHELTHVVQQSQKNQMGIRAAESQRIMRTIDYDGTRKRLSSLSIDGQLVTMNFATEKNDVQETVKDLVLKANLQHTSTFFHGNESGLLPNCEWANRNCSPYIEFNVAKISGMTRVVYDVRAGGSVYICPHYNGYIAVDNIDAGAKGHLEQVALENIGYLLFDYPDAVQTQPQTAEEAINTLHRLQEQQNN
ncbi:MAG: DUF4157 domain-containing protein [Nostoc sp. NMS1]|nr:DUF4157 domain-containing protein [Nostoc sp. NMS1]MBN3995170.1 DUF4157 domain-containing protein [Nostoc sp. NMS2]